MVDLRLVDLRLADLKLVDLRLADSTLADLRLANAVGSGRRLTLDPLASPWAENKLLFTPSLHTQLGLRINSSSYTIHTVLG